MLAALVTHASGNASSARAGRMDTEQVFESLDGGDKGYLTVDDLQAAFVSFSAEGSRRAAAADKPSARLEKLFARLDSDGDGQLSQAEFQAAVPRGLGGSGPHAPRDAKPGDAEPGGKAAAEAVQAYESVAQLGQQAAEA